MLGIPTEERETFTARSDAFIRIGDRTSTPEDVEQCLIAAQTLYAYLADQVEWRWHEPADELITHMISAREEDDQLTAN